MFGRACGNRVLKYLKGHRYHPAIAPDCWQPGVARVERWLGSVSKGDGIKVAALRASMQSVMATHFSVYRTEEVMTEGLALLEDLHAQLASARIDDGGRIFNTDLIEALELEHLMDLARVTAAGALARTESRGAHARDDYPKRDDKDWLRHTLAAISDGKVHLDYKPVRMQPMTVESFPPKERVY